MGRMYVGYKPLWADWHLEEKGGAWKLLYWPLWLWELVFYKSRVNVVDRKVTKEDWYKMQGEERFFHALFCYLGPPSHILWNIKVPLGLVMLVTLGTATYYELRAGCCPYLPDLDPDNVSMQCFRLNAFAMSLLLAARIRASYDRWWQARVGFTAVGSAAVALTQQACANCKDPWFHGEFMRWGVVWQHAIYQIINSTKTMEPEAAALLTEPELALYNGSRKPRQLVVNRLRQLVAKANLPTAQSQAMENVIQAGVLNAGNCTRVRFQGMPQALGMLSTGFVMIWLMLLPLGLYNRNGWFPLLTIFFMAVLMLGIDEICCQMENPFHLIPQKPYLKSTIRDTRRAVEEAYALKQIEAQQLDNGGLVPWFAKEKAKDADGHTAVKVADSPAKEGH